MPIIAIVIIVVVTLKSRTSRWSCWTREHGSNPGHRGKFRTCGNPTSTVSTCDTTAEAGGRWSVWEWLI